MVWLEQLLTSQSFAAAFGFWGPGRKIASGAGELTVVLPLRREVKSTLPTKRIRVAPASYAEDALVTRLTECPPTWTSSYGLDQGLRYPAALVGSPPDREERTASQETQLGADGSPEVEEELECCHLETSDLRVANLNVDGAGRDAIGEICARIRTLEMDITVLIDTRQKAGDRTIEGVVMERLGSRYRVFTHVDAEGDVMHCRRVGGVAFIVGPRISHPKLHRLCQFGSTAGLDCRLGDASLFVLVVYWPQPNKSEFTLWTKLEGIAGGDPIDYLQALALQALTAARAEGRRTFMLGDFNSDVNTSDIFFFLYFTFVN